MFWSKVDRSAGADGCWPWTGARNRRGGYGTICINYRRMAAHRVAFLLGHGRPGLPLVLHDCDNPPCVNPRHLHEGTTQQNTAEAKARGLILRGTQVSTARLTAELVAELRRQVAGGSSLTDLARALDLRIGTVHEAVSGKNWRWLKTVHDVPALETLARRKRLRGARGVPVDAVALARAGEA
jgi:hypothetical protein